MPEHRGLTVAPSLPFDATAAAIEALHPDYVAADLQAALDLLDRSRTMVVEQGAGQAFIPPSAAQLELLMVLAPHFAVLPNFEGPLGAMTYVHAASGSAVSILFVDASSFQRPEAGTPEQAPAPEKTQVPGEPTSGLADEPE